MVRGPLPSLVLTPPVREQRGGVACHILPGGWGLGLVMARNDDTGGGGGVWSGSEAPLMQPRLPPLRPSTGFRSRALRSAAVPVASAFVLPLKPVFRSIPQIVRVDQIPSLGGGGRREDGTRQP